jgi:hypothetical protein
MRAVRQLHDNVKAYAEGKIRNRPPAAPGNRTSAVRSIERRSRSPIAQGGVREIMSAIRAPSRATRSTSARTNVTGALELKLFEPEGSIKRQSVSSVVDRETQGRSTSSKAA